MAEFPMTIGGQQVRVFGFDTGLGSVAQRAQAIARRLERETGRGGFMERTNQAALRWIQQDAAQNLRKAVSANGRPPIDSRQGPNLLEAIQDDRYSSADERQVNFLIRAKIFPDVPYYASIEYGDRSQIGRQIYFSIYGTTPNVRGSGARGGANPRAGFKATEFRHPKRPDVNRASRAAIQRDMTHYSDRLIGPRERDGRKLPGTFKATIRRPVPEYRYGRDAEDHFLGQRVYFTILEQETKNFSEEFSVQLENS